MWEGERSYHALAIEEFFGDDGTKATKHVMASVDNNDAGAEAGTRNHGEKQNPKILQRNRKKKGRKGDGAERKKTKC